MVGTYTLRKEYTISKKHGSVLSGQKCFQSAKWHRLLSKCTFCAITENIFLSVKVFLYYKKRLPDKCTGRCNAFSE